MMNKCEIQKLLLQGWSEPHEHDFRLLSTRLAADGVRCIELLELWRKVCALCATLVTHEKTRDLFHACHA
jgi:hypothetical protein